MPATEAQAGPVRGLDAAALGDVLAAVLDLVRDHEDELNRLNVFPVRDHDTGTNMTLTLEGAVKAVEATSGRPMRELARAVVDAAMVEARGNSGTILAEVLRGLFETWAPLEPVEGTILTVARVTADAMEELAPADVNALLAGAAEAAGRAVEATTAQLAALRRAGVVDAAARGFELCVRAFATTVAEEGPRAAPSEAPGPVARASGTRPAAEAATQAPAPGDGRPGPAFEVQYLLASGEEEVRDLERSLATIGDSITVARGDGRYRVHVHTDDAGAAIEEGVQRGRVSSIQVAYLGDASRSG